MVSRFHWHRVGLLGCFAICAILGFGAYGGWQTVEAAAGVAVSVTFPPAVSVGQTGAPATLQISNTSTPPDSLTTFVLGNITLVPSCGTTASTVTGDCPTASADPGVFQINATAIGEAGTACAGVTFTVTVNNAATGQVRFTPVGGPVSLTAAGAGSTCLIDFTFTVLKVPAIDANPGAPGSQTNQIGYASGFAFSEDFASAIGTSTVTVVPAQPGISTSATPTATVGMPISDTATLAGGSSPTGTITFTLFGPNNTTCSGAPIFTSTVTVNAGAGSYPSAPFGPTAPGVYDWVAVYNGDTNNVPASTACGDGGEVSTVSQATPALATAASAPVTIGAGISDTATLSGGYTPGGTITFSAFGPNNSTCTGTPTFTSTVTVTGNNTYPSGSFTPTAAGLYRFVAAYSGDAANAAITTACTDPQETVMVSSATPTLTTRASAGGAVGTAVIDTATLAGGSNPGGSISFALFGPNDSNCSGTPAFTATVPVNAGAGAYQSGSFTPAASGTYRFVATYSGDGNNNPAGPTACTDPQETVVITAAAPTLTTRASAGGAVGTAITDTATLSNGAAPSGQITFTLFGPNNATCTGTPLVSSAVTVTGNSNYPSAPFTPTAPGTYRFVATYSGDANNNAAGPTSCTDANEAVVITAAAPVLTTRASAGGTIGTAITDTATLAAGSNPTGMITFTLFGPNNASCSGAPVFSSAVTVTGNGDYTSAPFTPTAPGTYRFVASYNGDANNLAAGPTACADPQEAVVISRAAPTVTTRASAGGTIGTAVIDTATLAGGVAPTGSITFTLFGPNNAACSGAPIFSSTVTVSGNGDYPSAPFTPTSSGMYRFVASYNGDANNNAAGPTACSDPQEAVVIGRAAPTLTTRASAGGPVGTAITDTATLSNGAAPAGTITFTLFGPNNATCAGTPIFSSTITVSGNGSYPSDPFTPTSAGTYRFIATYSGDGNNNAAGPTACTDANEAVVITAAAPVLTTRASAGGTIGTAVTDTATLAAGSNPTGTITFTLFGPNNASCSGTPVFSSAVAVSGNGDYTSAPFTPTASGTYRFVASYSGDANNLATGPTACTDPQEAVVIGSAAPTLVTQASAGGPIGTAVTDTATLAGGVAPTGSITFTLFGPNNATCTGTPLVSTSVTVTGNGNYPSAPFTPTAPGTYRFVAAYSGDGNNGGVTTACTDPQEAVVIAAAGTSLTTRASAGGPVGTAISDTATLAGGSNPAGTITFTAFGPDNAYCTGSPVFTMTTPVSGNGSYTSAAFTPAAAGTYRFVASYSGDGGNAPTSTACSDPAESVTISAATSVALGSSSNPSLLGQPVSFGAVVTCASGVPTGTMSFFREGTLLGTQPVGTGGSAVLTVDTLPLGSSNIVAQYGGNAACPAGTSNIVVQVVNSPAAKSTVSFVAPTISGQSVTLSVTVACTLGAPGGTVSFAAGGAVLGTVPVGAGGIATITLVLPPGTLTITASYSGAGSCPAANASAVVPVPAAPNAGTIVLAFIPTGVLTVTISGCGTVTDGTAGGPGLAGMTQHQFGDLIVPVATPCPGYQFSGWTGGGPGCDGVKAPTCTIVMPPVSVSLTATFVRGQ